MADGKSALFLDEDVVVSRITVLISDRHEPEYTIPLRVWGSLGTFGCSYFDEKLRLNKNLTFRLIRNELP